MEHSLITIKKAKRTKNGAQLTIETPSMLGNVAYRLPLHPDLIEALAKCNAHCAAMDERQHKAPRFVTCTGLVRIEQGDNVGYQLTGEQLYSSSGSQGFATRIFWVSGETMVLTADQRRDIEHLEKEWQLYAAEEKFGEIAQQELDFDSEPSIEPEAAEPIDTDQNVKSAAAPTGKKKSKKPAPGTKPSIPVHIKNKAAKAASAYAETTIKWSELEAEWHDITKWYTVMMGKRLIGYIKCAGEKPVFEETTATREDLEQNDIILTGPEADAAAKDLRVAKSILAARIKTGDYLEREGVVMTIAALGFSVREKAWYATGYTAPNVPHNMLVDSKLIFHGPTLAVPDAPAKPGELITYGNAIDTIGKRKAQFDMLKQMYGAAGDNVQQLEDLDEKTSRAKQSMRKWIKEALDPALDEPKHFTMDQQEEITNHAFGLQRLFDELGNTIADKLESLASTPDDFEQEMAAEAAG